MASEKADAVRRVLREHGLPDLAGKTTVVFATTTCPYCKRAEAALHTAGIAYSVCYLDRLDKGGALRQELKSVTGQSSVPNVVTGDRHIGGCDDTLRHVRAGTFLTGNTSKL